MRERLRILILAANPKNMPRLKLEAEHRLLRNKMRDNAEVGNCELFVEWAARRSDVEQALKTCQPHVLHFAGHGQGDGICLEDDKGASSPVRKEEWFELINSASGPLRLVVLNACSSAPQTERLSQEVDYIVATTSSVTDDAAVQLAADLYQELACGGTVREAFHQAQGKLAAGGEKAQADRYQLLVRDGAEETRPLLPPSADHETTNEETLEVADVISGRKLYFANQVVEGTRASLPPNERQPNERNRFEIRAERVKGDEISFVNKHIKNPK